MSKIPKFRVDQLVNGVGLHQRFIWILSGVRSARKSTTGFSSKHRNDKTDVHGYFRVGIESAQQP